MYHRMLFLKKSSGELSLNLPRRTRSRGGYFDGEVKGDHFDGEVKDGPGPGRAGGRPWTAFEEGAAGGGTPEAGQRPDASPGDPDPRRRGEARRGVVRPDGPGPARREPPPRPAAAQRHHLP